MKQKTGISVTFDFDIYKSENLMKRTEYLLGFPYSSRMWAYAMYRCYSYPFQGSQYKEDTGVNALVEDLRQISTGFLVVVLLCL